MNDFKNIFFSLRTDKKFSQEQMAKELGVSKSSIAMWETGKRLPSPDGFEQIADYFNVDIDFLYGRTDVKRKILFDEYGDEFIHSNNNLKILEHYDKLNVTGKQEATKRVEELSHIPKYTKETTLMAAHSDNINNPEELDKIHEDIIKLSTTPPPPKQ